MAAFEKQRLREEHVQDQVEIETENMNGWKTVVDCSSVFSSSLLPPSSWEGSIFLANVIIAQDRYVVTEPKYSQLKGLELGRATTCVNNEAKIVLPVNPLGEGQWLSKSS